MKQIKDIRRENLVRLTKSYKSQRQFAQGTGLATSHLNQLLNGVREMGEEVARRIENSLGLSVGFMSIDPDMPPAPPIIEPELQRLPADELSLLTNYRKSSSRRKEMLRETAEMYLLLDESRKSS